MKVIVAGFSKTGTKTMAAALREFGYNVFDYEENIYKLGDEWRKILTVGGSVEDFRRMYEGVDATTDLPACYFWEELHEAFPEAKIIFMSRETEEIWLKSMKFQIASASDHWILSRLFNLSPTKNRVHETGAIMCRTIFGSRLYDPWPFNYTVNETVLKKIYRIHNAYVLHKAPKEKLLIYNVKDGWEPLCKFLGEEIPSIPFPHKNVRGDIIENMLQHSPMLQQMKKEVICALSAICVVVSFLLYFLCF